MENLLLFGPALLALLALAIAAPLVGAFLHARGTALLGLATPQAALFGMALGAAVNSSGHAHAGDGALWPYLWAAIATAVGLFATSARPARGPSDAGRAAALFVVAGASTVLVGSFAPAGALEVEALVRGEVLAVGYSQLAVVGSAAGAVTGWIWARWRHIAFVGADRTAAIVVGLDVVREELLFALAVGTIAVVGTTTLGPLPVFGLLVLPPLALHCGASSMATFLVGSAVLGAAGAALGVVLSFELDLPMGASTVAGLALLAIFARLARRRPLQRASR